MITTWGAVVGSAMQIAVQLPMVLKLLHGLPLVFDTASKHVRNVVVSFGPVFVSRGVVQLSAFIDGIISTFLGSGAVAALAYAQQLAYLPISLFGMSVS